MRSDDFCISFEYIFSYLDDNIKPLQKCSPLYRERKCLQEFMASFFLSDILQLSVYHKESV